MIHSAANTPCHPVHLWLNRSTMTGVITPRIQRKKSAIPGMSASCRHHGIFTEVAVDQSRRVSDSVARHHGTYINDPRDEPVASQKEDRQGYGMNKTRAADRFRRPRDLPAIDGQKQTEGDGDNDDLSNLDPTIEGSERGDEFPLGKPQLLQCACETKTVK